MIIKHKSTIEIFNPKMFYNKSNPSIVIIQYHVIIQFYSVSRLKHIVQGVVINLSVDRIYRKQNLWYFSGNYGVIGSEEENKAICKVNWTTSRIPRMIEIGQATITISALLSYPFQRPLVGMKQER